MVVGVVVVGGAIVRAVMLPEPCQAYAGTALSAGKAITNARTNRSARMRLITDPPNRFLSHQLDRTMSSHNRSFGWNLQQVSPRRCAQMRSSVRYLVEVEI